MKVWFGSVTGAVAVSHAHQFPYSLTWNARNLHTHHDPINDHMNH